MGLRYLFYSNLLIVGTVERTFRLIFSENRAQCNREVARLSTLGQYSQKA